MDDEMKDSVEEGFLDVEIDFDYEFDALRYFDFSRKESPSETLEAELWFDTAGSYPPSPFVAKLNLGEGILNENINTSLDSKDSENADSSTIHSDIIMSSELSDENCKAQEGMDKGVVIDLLTSSQQNFQSEQKTLKTGLTFHSRVAQVAPNAKSKYAFKSSFSRGSTLMKPTASQLAKQNRLQEVHVSSRFLERSQKLLPQNNERSLENPSMVESQAAKRQKLEGGHLRKVPAIKQQSNLIHKAPKKDGPGDLAHTKLTLTIPREPDLETAHRAQRMRPKKITELGQSVKSTTYMFRARPLNRKILEAPSLPLPKKSTPRLPEFQEFHLKTSERAMQHSSAASSTSLPCNQSDEVVQKIKAGSIKQNGTTDSNRSNTVDAPKQEGCEIMHKFKARPLNKKIFSSKGDIGVFRNSKREATVPMEFNFPTDKRFQYNPPVELFNKLSLTSELRQNTDSQPKLPRHTCMPTKGSKENATDSFHQEHRIMHVVKDKVPRFVGKQIQCGGDGEISDIGSRVNISRSLGIR